MLYTLLFFSSKCSLFHNANLFGSCIIHILYTGCAKIKKKKESGAKGLMFSVITNIYNKKTKGTTLMKLFTTTGKLDFFNN